MKRRIIPYNPKLKQLASRLRKNMTYSEVRFWMEVRNGRVMGYDFDRQKPIGNYIVDFFCKDLSLAIEIDGITHYDEGSETADGIRQAELENMGVTFLRFSALQVVHDTQNVLRALENWIFTYEEEYGVAAHVLKKREVDRNR
jgi:very-short-patch-repair endonuclease